MPRDNYRGFSLMEFSLGLVIAGVGALLMAPLYYKAAENHRANAYTNELVATLTYARTHALMQMQPVSLCSSSDGVRCTDTPWAQGYIVFVDNGVPGKVDAEDRRLSRHAGQNQKVTITLAGAQFVRFSASGALLAYSTDAATGRENGDGVTTLARWLSRLSPMATAHASSEPPTTSSSVGTFTVCAGHTGRMVKLSPLGRVSTTATLCR